MSARRNELPLAPGDEATLEAPRAAASATTTLTQGVPIVAQDEIGETFFGKSFVKIGRDVETEVICPVREDEVLAVTALDRPSRADLERYATIYHYLAFILIFEFHFDPNDVE